MLVCDHKVVHEDFKFLGNESNRYLLELKERLLQILFYIYQLVKYQNILQLFLCHRVNGVNLKMEAVSSESLFRKTNIGYVE